MGCQNCPQALTFNSNAQVRKKHPPHKKTLLSLTDNNKSKYYSAIHEYLEYFVTVILNSFSELFFNIKFNYFCVSVLTDGSMFVKSKFYLWLSLNLLAKASIFRISYPGT